MASDAFAAREPSRRAVLLGTLSCAGLVLAGCSPAGDDDASAERKAAPTGKTAPSAPTGLAAMTVFRDPSCGCCEAWAEIARKAGYDVDLRDDQDMPAVKRRLGVPEELASCHTAEVGGMVVEGHVPLEEVARLLREKPQGIRGIAVPGMPLGSPGMETPDGTKQPFQVIAFDTSGKTSVFRA
jgi:hypothetical protein